MSMLEVKDLSVSYGDLHILRDVSFSVEPGQWLMIIGPNGAGKTTILNSISRGVPYTGTIVYQGRDIRRWKPRELALNIGLLSQNNSMGYAFTVEEIVRLGRYAHSASVLSGDKDGREEAIDRAIALTGLEGLRNQSSLTLSGGELQRTFLAQLFAQDPRLLMLDEPTNHLDLVYQKQVFNLIREWLTENGRAVVSVVHDLSLARAYGTHALLLSKGRTVAEGPVSEVTAPKLLNEVYSMDVYSWMREMYSQWTDEDSST
ncbi:MAG: ABC transporter ATP-binding protein [Oscillospiraceae bacterium]|nr:ABC transporter ATP-binding protein [Oscillospiraceae bacterium]